MDSLSGTIAIVTIRVEAYRWPPDPVAPTPPGSPPQLAGSPLANLPEMYWEQADAIRDELQGLLTMDLKGGPLDGCYVDRPALRKGSIEILAVIAGVGVALKSVNEIADQLDKLTERARRFVSASFAGLHRADALVWGSWEPGAALKRASETSPGQSNEPVPRAQAPTSPSPRAAGSLAWSRVLLAYLGLASVTAIALTLIIRLT